MYVFLCTICCHRIRGYQPSRFNHLTVTLADPSSELQHTIRASTYLDHIKSEIGTTTLELELRAPSSCNPPRGQFMSVLHALTGAAYSCFSFIISPHPFFSSFSIFSASVRLFFLSLCLVQARLLWREGLQVLAAPTRSFNPGGGTRWPPCPHMVRSTPGPRR